MANQALKQCKVEDFNRVASAPYNFVPLPEKVVQAVTDAEKQLPDHDCYGCAPNVNTGYFDVQLTTKSPLYVRAALNRKEFDTLEEKLEEQKKKPFGEQIKNKRQFYSHVKEKSQTDRPAPVIPGGSLRGMLRQLLEIVSYSRMDKNRISNRKLFFRSMDTSSLKDFYQGVMKKKCIFGGFYRKIDGGFKILPCRVVIVDEEVLDKNLKDLHEGDEPSKTPKWIDEFHQYQRVWVKVPANDKVEEISVVKNEGWHEGVFVKSGYMEKKKREFVFLLPSDRAKPVSISKQTLDVFYDEQQITKWQEEAFPKNTPKDSCRGRNGYLQTNPKDEIGDPVFFLSKDSGSKREVVFLGRAQMFRLPFDYTIHDFIPETICNSESVDLADAMFSFISKYRSVRTQQGHKAHAYASRVAVTDATLVSYGEKGLWFNEKDRTVPPILASPKPTAFQHYLVQTTPDTSGLRHYSSKPVRDTVLRGVKVYWHQGKRKLADLKPLPNSPNVDANGNVEASSTQHTQMYPVNEHVTFKFCIYFENLTDVEFGALCWTLHPVSDPESKAEDYCHSLGMGKPFGMGAAKLNATLHLENRQQRYQKLFDGEQWFTGINSSEELSNRITLENRTKAFEDSVLKALGLEGQCSRLYELERIATLLKMMEWPGYPAEYPATKENRNIGSTQERRPNTRYMTIELEGQLGTEKNEYSKRPVLPPPSQFGDWPAGGLHLYEPNWPIPTESKTSLADEDFLQVEQVLEEDDSAPLEKPTVTAVLLQDAKKYKAQVRNVEQETEVFTCQNMPLMMKEGDIVIVEVTRKKDEIVTAKYLRKKDA